MLVLLLLLVFLLLLLFADAFLSGTAVKLEHTNFTECGCVGVLVYKYSTFMYSKREAALCDGRWEGGGSV